MVDWLIVDVHRGSRLDNLAIIHNENPVTHGKSFFLIVSDKDKGNAQSLLQFTQFVLHVCSQFQVQR
ncbi:Uncharacterised protein [Mycobacterium tuberculosis]|nr:Uncharacterised protein [Mycobacterium tuberculosis]